MIALLGEPLHLFVTMGVRRGAIATPKVIDNSERRCSLEELRLPISVR
ncbi:hypothetical protein [Bradyrhizobium sp. CB2312]|nr:hypothetical protein [Bradyrhizobium sp. CB2312]WFU71200.1 hypothetical protein QA642_39165 [Bradyrhizobium sp. CB2312]